MYRGRGQGAGNGNYQGNHEEDDDLGEDMGVGRRGGFLSTTGSFQLSSGGGGNDIYRGRGQGAGNGNYQGNHEEDDDLGEDMGVGRRGGFLSTTGSFQLSSGGGGNDMYRGRGQGAGNGNYQGNHEEDDDLGEDMGVGRRGGFLSTTGS